MNGQERIPLAPLAAMLVLSMTAAGCYTTLATAPPPSGIDRIGEVQEYPRPEMVPPTSANDSTLEAYADENSRLADTYDAKTGLVVINNYYDWPRTPGWSLSIGYEWGWDTCIRPYRHHRYSPWYNETWGVWSWDPWYSPYGPDGRYRYDPWYSSWYWSDPWYSSWYDPWYAWWYDPWYYPMAGWHNPYRPGYDHDHHDGGWDGHGGSVIGPGSDDRRPTTGPGTIIPRRDNTTVTNRTTTNEAAPSTVTTSTRNEGRNGSGTIIGRRNQPNQPSGAVNKSNTENSGTESPRVSGGTREDDNSFFDTISRRVSQEIDAHVRVNARTQMDEAERSAATRRNPANDTSNEQAQPSRQDRSPSQTIQDRKSNTRSTGNGVTSRRTSSTDETTSSVSRNTGASEYSRGQESGSSSGSYSSGRSGGASESYSPPSSSERSTGSSGSSGGSYQAPRSGGGESGGGGGGGRAGAGAPSSRRR